MRIRTKTFSRPLEGYGIINRTEYPNIPSWNSIQKLSFGAPGTVYKTAESSITDVDSLRPQVRIGRDGKWERIRYTRRAPYTITANVACNLKPVHPCTHVKKTISWKGEHVTIASQVLGQGGFDERTITSTATFPSGASLYSYFTGISPDQAFDSALSSLVADEFRKPDWFALMSRFDEMCEQFVPSSFLMGEDLLQGSVFVDAIKLVINPTNAIRFLLNWARRLPEKKVREMNLGQFSRIVAKESSNQYLVYQFGIKPAISSVRDALAAHRKVDRRMQYLAQSRGDWIPVRARTEMRSGIVNAPLNQVDLGEPLRFQWQHRNRINTACLGAWGRVREDLNLGEAWKAYLQYFGINKVAGLAWELIPFSFVVDWFTNAQERINMIRIPVGDGPFTEFARFCASEKHEDIEDLYCIPGFVSALGMPVTTPTDPFVVATKTTTLYSRYPKIPDVSGVVDTSTLGLFHYGTTAALLVQRYLK